jgi:hypothetical protein
MVLVSLARGPVGPWARGPVGPWARGPVERLLPDQMTIVFHVPERNFHAMTEVNSTA